MTDARMAAGMDLFAARVGKSTVYDCFRLGRRRLSVGLVREVARALGADDSLIDEWISRRLSAPAEADPTVEPIPTPFVQEVGAPAWRQVLLLMVACVVLNLLGRGFVMFFDFPLHLDMMGTAIAAIALGPWRGALVALVTGVAGVAMSGESSLVFTVVGVAGALLWGYGVNQFRAGASISRFLSLNLITALICAIIATPLLLLLYDGATRHSFDSVTGAFGVIWSSYAVSVFFSTSVTSILDKMLSGFVALGVIARLAPPMRRTMPIASFHGALDTPSQVERKH